MMHAARSYLDWNATAPVRAEAAEMMLRALLLEGNPSSVHAEGRAARAALERARAQVADLVGADARRVVFTSGGSEANVFALTPSLGLNDKRSTTRLLMSATEHPCVREGHRFPAADVATIPVNPDGVIALDVLKAALNEPGEGRKMVSVHVANNETGVVCLLYTSDAADE